MTTAMAQWSKAYRQRRRAGRIVVEVEVDEAKITAALIEARLLSPLQADDRAEVERAAQRMVEIFCGDEQ
jgi:hypothetical protein